MNIKWSEGTRVCRRELLCEVIRQVLETWRPHYLVDAKVDLFYEPEILAVHRARALSFIVLLHIPFTVLLWTKMVVGPCLQPISSKVSCSISPFFSL